MEVWADDLAGLMDALGIDAGARPRHLDGRDDRDRLRRQVPGAHDLGRDQLRRREARRWPAGSIFKNWIDIARMDPDGPGSRILAELIAWQALSKAFLETPDGVAAIDTIQQILRDSNRIEVFTAACQAMCDMDIREWLPKITSPALVLGGDEDLMTPWDQGPDGAGQEAIYEGIPNAEKHVIRGSNHSTIFDNTEEHNRVVIDFFPRHSRRVASAGGRGIRGRADPGRAADDPLARPVRDQLHVLPQPGHVRARGDRRRRLRAAASGGRSWRSSLGQALAYAVMVPIAEVGVDYGLTGQVAARATLGFWGARLLSSPYRVIAATYWFAAQALAGARTRSRRSWWRWAPASRRSSRSRWGSRCSTPRWRCSASTSCAGCCASCCRSRSRFVAVMVALYASTDDPRFDVGRVFDSPDQHLTWVGFAGVVTLMAGSSLTLVHERRRLLPLHADAPRRADRPRRLRARRGVRRHVHRRLRGGGDRRDATRSSPSPT